MHYNMPMPLQLTGRIFREEGMFVAELAEIRQCTWAHTLPQLLGDVPRLVIEHFHGLRDLGTLADELAKLGIVFDGKSFNVNIHVTIGVDALPVPDGTSTSVDSNVSVAVAA